MAVYLIGGPPKCGKTTLAKRMSKELGIPWISSDTLENIVYAYLPKEQHLAAFPHAYLRGDSNDEFYAKYSPKEIVRGYIQQGKTTYEAIRMMAETYLTDEDDFIVEGYHVTPEIAHRIVEQYGTEHIRAAFLVKHDKKKFVEDIHKSTTPNDWILRKTKDEATLAKIARMVAVYAEYIEREAGKYGLAVFATDVDFASSLEDAMKYLAGG